MPIKTIITRFLILSLSALAPPLASARVPYQSKGRNADPPSAQIASATAGDSGATSESASPVPTKRPAADSLGLPGAGDDTGAAEGTCAAGGLPNLGTAVRWMPTPDEAGKLAEKERKLLFLIHVSGNFARQGFT